MKNIKYILSIVLLLLLSSCSISPNGPDFGGNKKVNNNKDRDELSVNIDEIENLALTRELQEREKVIKNIKYKQEFLQDVTNQLEKNIDTYFKFISNTKDLIVIDLKIIKSVQEGLIDESKINRDNYIYLYTKALNTKERKYILDDLDYWIEIFSDDEEVLNSYITHIDKNQEDFISKENSFVFNIINYYIKKGKYKKNLLSHLKQIEKNMNDLKISSYEINLSNNLFKKGLLIEINKSNIQRIKTYLLK